MYVMKLPDLDSVVVYYLVVLITVATLLVYIHAGDVIPLVGFLLAGSLMYSLYPNKSIALVAGVVIASMLRISKREGFTEGVDETDSAAATADATATAPATTTDPAVVPSVDASVANTATVVSDTNAPIQLSGTKESAPAEVQPQSYLEAPPPVDFVPAPVTASDPAPAAATDSASAPASVSEPPPATVTPAPTTTTTTTRCNQLHPQARRDCRQRERARAQAAQAAQANATSQEYFADLNPAEFSKTDMNQLASIIDKTTELLKMLPDGFLAKASL